MFGFISTFFKTFLYNPLYNGLIFLIDILPSPDVGIAIILFTILIKLVLFPLSQKAVKTQIETKKIQPELEKIKKENKDDRQKQAEEMMRLYKEHNINPFSGILQIFIQLPIIFALYYIFLRGGLPVVNQEILYSFVPTPENINVMFLGIVDVTGKSAIISFFVGLSQYFQVRYSSPISTKKKEKGEERSFQDDLARSMGFQLKYVLPVFVGIISYTLSVAVSLYWVTNNLFTIGQEMYIRRQKAKEV